MTRNNLNYTLSKSALYRSFDKELIVIETESGAFHYFNLQTEPILNFFKTPHKLQELIETLGLDAQSDDADYLEGFCEFLKEKNILVEAQNNPRSSSSRASIEEIRKFVKPLYLRMGDKKLDEITFLCP